MTTTIPKDQITFGGENSHASYYRIGNTITVRVARNSQNQLGYLCLTCVNNHCAHAKAVAQFTTPRSREDAA